MDKRMTLEVEATMSKLQIFPNVVHKTMLAVGHHDMGMAIGINSAVVANDIEDWPRGTLEKEPGTNDGRRNDMLYILRRPGIYIDCIAYARLLQDCINMKSLVGGKLVHAHIIKSGFQTGIFLHNNLVNLYAKSGCVLDARQVFDKMAERSLVTWTAMITGYTQNGHAKEALNIFCQMQRVGRNPNQFTFGSILRACASLAVVENGKQVHAHIAKTGFECDVVVGSALVDMYCKCRIMESARQLFGRMLERDIVSWTAMITGYAQNQQGEEALKVFREMQRASMKPNQFTFASVVGACASLEALEQGKEVHARIIKAGFESDICVGSILTDMYAKCGNMEDASQLFDKMPARDMISWTAMIGGYAQNGCAEEALNLFCRMLLAGMKPDQFTFASVFRACASLAALEHGKQFHAHLVRTAFELDVFVGSALVDMYAKCGSIEDARNMFDKLCAPNVVSWNSMIAGYAQHGHSKEALQLFEQMQVGGTEPNHITFVGVFSACSHAGLVDEGCQFFDSMSRKYGITPRMEHYACIVDLLGRAGRLDEAEDFINEMPFKPDSVVWRSLLGACRIHGSVELGMWAADSLIDLEPHNSATYVLLSNIYADAGRWDDVEKVRKIMKNGGVTKEPGYSWIEIKNKVHAFVAGDRSHPQAEKIYANLERLTGQLKETGYMPHTEFVLHDVEEEQKEQFLFYHSEKLAIAFGLMSTPTGTPIRVIKNLRVCGDCHTATKFISRIVKREIVLRDALRFHHFKDGSCSCRDYW